MGLACRVTTAGTGLETSPLERDELSEKGSTGTAKPVSPPDKTVT